MRKIKENPTFKMSERERKWNIYHEFESKGRKRYLRNLSEKDSFRILKELYEFAYKPKARPGLNKFDMAKIKTLAKVHSIFNEVR